MSLHEIYRASSLPLELSDLREYSDIVVRLPDLAWSLTEKGILTSAQLAKIEARLGYRATVNKHNLCEGPLFSDGSTAEAIVEAGILGGINLTVPERAENEWKGLSRQEEDSTELVGILETLRKRLARGIEKGKYICTSREPAHDAGDDHNQNGLLASLNPDLEAEAIWIDDRWITSRKGITLSDGQSRPLLTTWEIVRILAARGAISAEFAYELNHRIRSGNIMVVPIEPEEISYFLERARIVDGVLTETAELRLLKQNFLMTLYGDVLSPSDYELRRLVEIVNLPSEVLRQIWNRENEALVTTRAKASWFARNFFVARNHFSHILPMEKDRRRDSCRALVSSVVVLIITFFDLEEGLERTREYQEWLEKEIIGDLCGGSPRMYREVAETLAEIVFSMDDRRNDGEESRTIDARRGVACYYAARLPETVRKFFLANNRVREMLSLRDSMISLDGRPPVDFSELMGGVRKCFTNGKPVEIKLEEGQSGVISIEDNHAVLSVAGYLPIHVLCSQFLHSDPQVRIEFFEAWATDTFSVLRHPVELRSYLEERWLTDLEIRNCLDASRASMSNILARIEGQLSDLSKVTAGTFLMTDDPEYFRGIAGPHPESTDMELYLSSRFSRWAEQLVRGHLDVAFEILLPFSFSGDSMLGAFLDRNSCSDDEIIVILDRLMPELDPVSKLGVLDISLRRAGRDAYFLKIADRLISELTGLSRCAEEGVYIHRLFSVLLGVIGPQVHMLTELQSQPPFWRNICAWAHAAHLVRFFLGADLREEKFVDFLQAFRGEHLLPASLFQLIDAPYARYHLSEVIDLQSYLRSRVLKICANYPLALDRLERNIDQEIGDVLRASEGRRDWSFFLSESAGGPIDWSRSGSGGLGKSSLEEWFLEDFPNLPYAQFWNMVGWLAPYRDFSGEIYDLIVSRIEAATGGGSDSEEKLMFFGIMAKVVNDLSLDTQVQGLLALGLQLARRDSSDEVFIDVLSSGLVCCSATRDQTDAMVAFSEFVLHLVWLADTDKKRLCLRKTLQQLKFLLPTEFWPFGRAELLIRAVD